MAAEKIVTLSASGQTDVEIFSTKLDHNMDKPLINISVPRQKAAMDAETEGTTYLIDIGRVKEIISVQGFILDDGTTSALTRKINFRKIVNFERSCTLTWGTGVRAQTYTGNISKVMFTEKAGIVGDAQPSGYEQDKNFAIQFSLMVGEEK